MHSAQPHGRFIYGLNQPLTEADREYGEYLYRQMLNFKKTGRLPALKWVHKLPSGAGKVTVFSIYGIEKIIFEPLEETPFYGIGKVHDEVPMWHSGKMVDRVFTERQAPQVYLTGMTRWRMNQYEGWRPGDAVLRYDRFRVRVNSRFPEFDTQSDSGYLYTQYAEQYPGWYSGSMKKVIQIIGGYGLQDERFPRLQMPERVAEAINREMEPGGWLPGYGGFPATDGTYRYDYRFDKTDGLTFAGKVPWLVRIDPTGIFVMPLPLVPATTTQAFRDWMEQVNDDEVLHVLDTFGGMPSGETWPGGEALTQWVKAGVVQSLGGENPTRAFYEHAAYSPAMGWAFSENGRQVVNTAWGESGQWHKGVMFGGSIHIGEIRDTVVMNPYGWAKNWQTTDKTVMRYLRVLYGLIEQTLSPEVAHALKYKITRAGFDEIEDRAGVVKNGQNAMQQELVFWYHRDDAPIASCSAHIMQTYSGELCGDGEIKFPIPAQRPELRGCYSFEFVPALKVSNPPRCHTVMFAYYSGNSLKVVHYLNDNAPPNYNRQEQRDGEFDDCGIIGSETVTEYYGGSSIMGHFVTTDFDEIEYAASDGESTTTTVGTYKGVGAPTYAMGMPPWINGFATRQHYYQHKTVAQSTGSGMTKDTCVCVPYYCREAVAYAHYKSTADGGSESERMTGGATGDAYSYEFWTYHPNFRWMGYNPQRHKAKPVPKEMEYVWLEFEYGPSGCSIADQGPWHHPIEDITSIIPMTGAGGSWLANPVVTGPQPQLIEYNWMKSFSDPTFQGGVNVDLGHVTDKCRLNNETAALAYFTRSPNEAGVLFRRNATMNCCGGTEYVLYDEAAPPGQRNEWGKSRLMDYPYQDFPYFIGAVTI